MEKLGPKKLNLVSRRFTLVSKLSLLFDKLLPQTYRYVKCLKAICQIHVTYCVLELASNVDTLS